MLRKKLLVIALCVGGVLGLATLGVNSQTQQPFTESEMVLALHSAPDLRQWDYGVELRYLVQDGHAYFLLKNFRMSGSEQDEWLSVDETGEKKVQPIETAFLDLNGVQVNFQEILGFKIASLPVSSLLGNQLWVRAFNAGGTQIFGSGINLLSY